MCYLELHFGEGLRTARDLRALLSVAHGTRLCRIQVNHLRRRRWQSWPRDRGGNLQGYSYNFGASNRKKHAHLLGRNFYVGFSEEYIFIPFLWQQSEPELDRTIDKLFNNCLSVNTCDYDRGHKSKTGWVDTTLKQWKSSRGKWICCNVS